MERYDIPRPFAGQTLSNKYSRPSSVRAGQRDKPLPRDKPPHLRGRRKDSNTSGSLFGSVTTEEDIGSDSVTLTSFTRLDTEHTSALLGSGVTDEKLCGTYETHSTNGVTQNLNSGRHTVTGFNKEAEYRLVESPQEIEGNATQTFSLCDGPSLIWHSRPNSNKDVDNSLSETSAANKLTPSKEITSSPIWKKSSNLNSPHASNDMCSNNLSDRIPKESDMINVPSSDNSFTNGSKRTKKKKNTNLSRKDSWSTSDLDKIGQKSGTDDDDNLMTFRYRNRQSSFATGKSSMSKKSVYLDLGVYQTLVRPGKVSAQHSDVEELTSDDSLDEEGEDLVIDATYGGVRDSYGEDTLKALSLIENKFDSHKRSQLRAMSFGFTSQDTGPSQLSPLNIIPPNKPRGSTHVSGLPYHEFSTLGTETPESDDWSLTERDVARIELFFKSQAARVHSCRCMAQLYLGSSYDVCMQTLDESLSFLGTGVPVLLLNTGTRAPRRRRELVILLAHKGTGLPLWHDKITYLSEYSEHFPLIHTMRVSGSMSKSVRFEFQDESAAAEFYSTYRSLTSNPSDQLWKMSLGEEQVVMNKRSRRAAQTKKAKLVNSELVGPTPDISGLRKDDISHPCNVELITSVDPTDRSFLSAFGNLLPTKKKEQEDSSSDKANVEVDEQEFRPRLPTH